MPEDGIIPLNSNEIEVTCDLLWFVKGGVRLEPRRRTESRLANKESLQMQGFF